MNDAKYADSKLVIILRSKKKVVLLMGHITRTLIHDGHLMNSSLVLMCTLKL